MANVGGLRPLDSAQPQVRQKNGRVVTQRSTSQRAQLSPSASPVNTFVQAQRPVEDNKLGQLAGALSSLAPALGKFSEDRFKAKEAEQASKLDFYRSKFLFDKETGQTAAAQAKQQFPEMVHTVAAKIAESQGALEGEEWTRERVQEILETPELRLNTQARNAKLDEMRQEAAQQAGDDGFYGNGFVSSFEKTVNQFETSWMSETAAHHEKIQGQKMSNDVSEVFMSGGDLEALDSSWKASGSLDNLQRNDIVFDTISNMAIASDDPSMLDRIPGRFLNAERKSDVIKLKSDIDNARYIKWTHSRTRSEEERDMGIRAGQTEILNRFAGGENVSPMDYRGTPELAAYVQQWANTPKVNSTASVAASQRLQSGILQFGTVGVANSSFSSDPRAQEFFTNRDVNADTLTDHILNRDDINPAEKQALIEKVPKLIEGMTVMRDDAVVTPMNDILKPQLRALAQSTNAEIQQLVSGTNLSARAMRQYENDIRGSFTAHFEDTGRWPTGAAKRALVDAAVDKTMLMIEKQTNLTGRAAPALDARPTPQRTRRWNGTSYDEVN
jgi:hypothetical protein